MKEWLVMSGEWLEGADRVRRKYLSIPQDATTDMDR
jgi:hypothetical protein